MLYSFENECSMLHSVAGTRDHFQADSGKDHKADLRITGKGASHSKSNFKDYVRQMVELYDLVEEGAGREVGGEHSSQETEKEEREASLLCETITCNGTEMVRERVAKAIGQGWLCNELRSHVANGSHK